MSLPNEDEKDKQANALRKSAASGVGESIVLKLRIAGETFERLSALETSELQATQEFLAQALHAYLDQGSAEPGGRDPNPDASKQKSHFRRVLFSEIESVVPPKAGIYEIHTATGVPLKVGISGNLRKRLLRHRASRQSALKLETGGRFCDPKDVRSKGSILAKHLYYDTTLVVGYDLTSETGRRSFLQERCYFTFEQATSRVEARELERLRERELPFRYKGRVQER